MPSAGLMYRLFAITTDPFIVLTSNVFAILGLRAMYFLLANMHERFHLLSYGLAIVLVFIGAKMLLIDVYKIPVAYSLGFTAVTLAVTMVLSLKIPPKGAPGGAYPFAAKKQDEREHVVCVPPGKADAPPLGTRGVIPCASTPSTGPVPDPFDDCAKNSPRVVDDQDSIGLLVWHWRPSKPGIGDVRVVNVWARAMECRLAEGCTGRITVPSRCGKGVRVT